MGQEAVSETGAAARADMGSAGTARRAAETVPADPAAGIGAGASSRPERPSPERIWTGSPIRGAAATGEPAAAFAQYSKKKGPPLSKAQKVLGTKEQYAVALGQSASGAFVIELLAQSLPKEYARMAELLGTAPLLYSLWQGQSPLPAILATLAAGGVRMFIRGLVDFLHALKEYAKTNRTRADKRVLRDAWIDFLTSPIDVPLETLQAAGEYAAHVVLGPAFGAGEVATLGRRGQRGRAAAPTAAAPVIQLPAPAPKPKPKKRKSAKK